MKSNLINWFSFFRLVENTQTYYTNRANSILIVAEMENAFCSNRHFWMVTYRKQFDYLEVLIQRGRSVQLWNVVSPMCTEESWHSMSELPNLVIFVLNNQVDQFLSFMKFFNRLNIPVVLIQTGENLGFRQFSQKIAFYFLLKSEFPALYTKNFVYFLLQILKLKYLAVGTENVHKFNCQFFDHSAFLILLNRWSSLIKGMQISSQKNKKFFGSKNKHNLRFLTKA